MVNSKGQKQFDVIKVYNQMNRNVRCTNFFFFFFFGVTYQPQLDT